MKNKTCAIIEVQSGDTFKHFVVRESRFLDFYEKMKFEQFTIRRVVLRGLKRPVDGWSILSIFDYR